MKNNKRIKAQKYVSEDTKEISRLIFITLGIVGIALGLYFLTEKVVNKKKHTLTDADFDYSYATVGTMFNRPYEEYYVFLYDSTDTNASSYESLVSKYDAKEDSIKIYTVDLSENLDKKYLASESNTKPSNPNEVKIKESALILIKNGKVEKYYENVEDYQKVLS